MARVIVSGNCKNLTYYEFELILNNVLMGNGFRELDDYICADESVYHKYLERYADYYKGELRFYTPDCIRTFCMYQSAEESGHGIHVCILDKNDIEDSRKFLYDLSCEIPFFIVENHVYWR